MPPIPSSNPSLTPVSRLGWERVFAEPSAAAAAAEILALASSLAGFERLLVEILRRVRECSRGDSVMLVVFRGGQWSSLADDGQPRSLPVQLLSDVLDRSAPQRADGWLAAPTAFDDAHQEVLCAHQASISLATFDSLAAAVGLALARFRETTQVDLRRQKLETLLALTRQWSETRETVPLLTAIAEAAARLLDADRASIFLWDRAHRILVARPALGVESGELQIPEDTGLVGEVVRTGQPRRVDRATDKRAIDRQVDRQLGYHTETLLCVPLRGGDGNLLGAFEVINKRRGDFTDDDEQTLRELSDQAATALSKTRDFEQLANSHAVLVDQAAVGVNLIGQSPPIEALRSTIARVAQSDLALLILGENGTGKEVVSRAIHYQSPRRREPLVAVNCAAIPETLLESELFGHEKGAFTDARETRIGKFELAARGTLFLDEIGDLSLGGQAKLLRVLEEKVVVRVGGSQPIYTDARVVAATNQDLTELVRQKRFREDLFYRLNVVTLELPPLRDRGGDIVLLAEHFLAALCRTAGRRPPKLLAGAKKRLVAHSWPGNVRELRNVMERLAYLASSDKIEADELDLILSPESRRGKPVPDDLEMSDATDQFQRDYIRRAIERSDGNMRQAADRLGLHRSNLYRKMRQLDMPADDP